MSTPDIYLHLSGAGFDKARADRLVDLFYRAAVFLVNIIENHGWKWRANYMREHAGCASGAQFTNTVSPYINELVFRKYPDLRRLNHASSSGGNVQLPF